MSRNHVSDSLASEIEARLRESTTAPEPTYTYDEPARSCLARVYSLLLDSARESTEVRGNTADDQDAPLSDAEVQHDE